MSSTTETATRRGRLDSLTGLRAFAAFAVFLTHVTVSDGGPINWVLHRITVQGGLGVTFFFALSGFVLTWSMRKVDSKKEFWRRRFARIYPVYFVTMIAGIAVTGYVGGPIELGPAVSSFALLQAWIPDQGYYFALNGVSWSLSAEALFYLCFPFFAPALVAISTRNRRMVQFGAFALIVVSAIVGRSIGGELGESWFIVHFPVVRILEFILGCSVAVDVIKKERILPLGFRSAVTLALATYVLAGVIDGPFTEVVLPIVPLLILLAACAERDASGKPTIFARPRLVYLGEISYCFYLCHQLVTRTVHEVFRKYVTHSEVFESKVVVAGSALISLLLAVVIAAALHAWVERPLEKRIRTGGRRQDVVVDLRGDDASRVSDDGVAENKPEGRRTSHPPRS